MWRSRRSPYRSSYGLRRKKSIIPWWGTILLLVPLGLFGLELALRLFANLRGGTPDLAASQTDSTRQLAYRLQLVGSPAQSESGSSHPSSSNQSSLKVQASPLMGYRLVPNQQSQFWQINPQGFRASAAIAATKPRDEIRIVVLGGSTAFGQFSSSNQTTFSNELEALLNRQVVTQRTYPQRFRPAILPYYADEVVKAMALPPRIREGRYRVINAAVPGYASGNEMAKFSLQMLGYQPDFVLLLNGYTDLLLPSTQEASTVLNPTVQSQSLPEAILGNFHQNWQNWSAQSYLWRSYQNRQPSPSVLLQSMALLGNTEVPLQSQITADPQELKRRSQRYYLNLKQVARLARLARLRLLIALQPEVTWRKPQQRSPLETKLVEQLGPAYTERVQQGYGQLWQNLEQVQQEFPQTVVPLNLNQFFAGSTGEVFQDAIHLTDAANSLLAQQLYSVISTQLALPSQPYSGSAPPRR